MYPLAEAKVRDHRSSNVTTESSELYCDDDISLKERLTRAETVSLHQLKVPTHPPKYTTPIHPPYCYTPVIDSLAYGIAQQSPLLDSLTNNNYAPAGQGKHLYIK